ncbi:chaplin [Streptomyces sp. BB1-1-1]|uniref:chaplin n=1 Tax=Streptomyces sp. BB1-1-1 TaxID=3074430 RepID=UPI0028776A26|nr:chaplin [Streptomyces sp. BB1-1-1]WND37527.1 chaplin [Streptomyces sp. BB1-1-1]
MRQTLSRGMVAAAAATGILSLCGSPALADSHADGAAKNSPGVASGNAVQVPVDVPVNACGNTVDVVAALNPAFGNECENSSDEQTGGSVKHGAPHGDDGSAPDGGYGGEYGEDVRVPSGASADGAAVGSPGVGSGNDAQVPVDVPVNLCGNTVDVIAALNPVFGNSCDNQAEEPPGYGEEEPPPPTTPPTDEEKPPPAEEEEPPPSGEEEPPPPAGEKETPPAPQVEQPPVLAETGSEAAMPAAAAAGAALIAGGAILYRRARVASRR